MKSPSSRSSHQKSFFWFAKATRYIRYVKSRCFMNTKTRRKAKSSSSSSMETSAQKKVRQSERAVSLHQVQFESTWWNFIINLVYFVFFLFSLSLNFPVDSSQSNFFHEQRRVRFAEDEGVFFI